MASLAAMVAPGKLIGVNVMPMCNTRAFVPDELPTVQAPRIVYLRPNSPHPCGARIAAANSKPDLTTDGHGLLGKLLALIARLKATDRGQGVDD